MEPINNIERQQRAYNAIGIGEYFVPMGDDDSDYATLSWQQFCQVINITKVVEPKSQKKHSTPLNELENHQLTFEEDWEDEMFSSKTLIKSYVSKDV